MEEINPEEQQVVDTKPSEEFAGVRTISSYGNIFGLVNGMVGGGVSLVLPQIGIQAGYINIIWLSLFSGYLAYYTADLIVLHMGTGKDIKQSVLSHFKQEYRYMAVYSFIIWFSFIPILLAYFRLTCLQIEGLMGMKLNQMMKL